MNVKLTDGDIEDMLARGCNVPTGTGLAAEGLCRVLVSGYEVVRLPGVVLSSACSC